MQGTDYGLQMIINPADFADDADKLNSKNLRILRYLRANFFYPQTPKICVQIPPKNTLFYAEKRPKIGTFAHDKKLWKITTI